MKHKAGPLTQIGWEYGSKLADIIKYADPVNSVDLISQLTRDYDEIVKNLLEEQFDIKNNVSEEDLTLVWNAAKQLCAGYSAPTSWYLMEQKYRILVIKTD